MLISLMSEKRVHLIHWITIIPPRKKAINEARSPFSHTPK
jgi:hypothetical protein